MKDYDEDKNEDFLDVEIKDSMLKKKSMMTRMISTMSLHQTGRYGKNKNLMKKEDKDEEDDDDDDFTHTSGLRRKQSDVEFR
ncbi:unnamed protein product [Ambrosiozyma monospora]|uniref:Unnamed protein product n=1 Tax=Ambrosiozyma monospora TaxID=43982 RepID=A0ACB5TSU1_AMBMO|nr:unnamed protein product [Ambrosiozyma monospora]